jgi:nucleoside-triphosphatase
MRRIASGLAGRALGGFTTAEIREKGVRVGFALESFDGARAVLAHVGIPSPHRVGRYGVDVAALARFVASALDPAARPDLYLVDEIGRMECLSDDFVTAMERLLDGEIPVVATVGERGAGLIERVKRRENAVLWTLTHANRDQIPSRVLGWLGSLSRHPGALPGPGT